MHNQPTVNLLWKQHTAVPFGNRSCALGYLNDCICLPTETGNVIGIDAYKGNVKWRFQLPKFQNTNFMISSGENFIFSTFNKSTTAALDNKANLYKLNCFTGNVEWRYEFPVHSVSAPALEDERGYVFGTDHYLYTLNVNSNQMVGKVLVQKAQWSPYPPIATQGYVIIPGGFGFAQNSCSVAIQQNRIEWEFPYGSYYTPVVIGQIVCLISGMHTLHFVDLKTGLDKGNIDADKAFTTPLIVGKQGLILVGIREKN